jgi:hypothetical protein
VDITQKNQSKTFWTKEEDEIIINEFIKRTPHIDVQKLLPHRGLMAVKHRARNLGLNRHYSVNDSFFASPNIINSYVAGFIASDGNITTSKGKKSSKKTYMIRWGLSKKDTPHLDLICNIVDFTGHPLLSKTRPEVNLTIYSKKWVQDLEINFNIVPAKTLILKPPINLDFNCSLAFIIGYIDGDGSILFRKDNRPALSVTGTEDLLIWIRSIFNTLAPPIKYSIGAVSKIKHANAYYYGLSGRRVKDIVKILFDLPTPKLERKWNTSHIERIINWEPKS